MPLVILLRGVNVGGKSLRVRQLAASLGDLDVVSVGAAGTFVMRGKATLAAAREAFAEALPFEADVLAMSAPQFRKLAALEPAKGAPPDARPYVTFLASRPKSVPDLPLDFPPKGKWMLRVAAVEPGFAVSLRRATQGEFYPNEILEKTLGVRATTRGWAIVASIEKALSG